MYKGGCWYVYSHEQLSNNRTVFLDIQSYELNDLSVRFRYLLQLYNVQQHLHGNYNKKYGLGY